MSILLWIVFGALVGWVSSLIMKSNSSSLLMDIVLGVVGAFIGNLIMNLFGFAGVTGFDIYSFLVAIAGAVVLIWIGRRLAPAV